MNRTEKTIDKFGLELKKPNFLVFIILTLFLLGEIFLIYNKQHGTWKDLDALFFVFGWLVLLITPLVEWLRNVYVLIGWFVYCLLWFFYKVDLDFFTAIIPVGVLFYSQLSRLIFRWIMGYHPIHLIFNQYASHRYSAFNKRNSTKVDFRYSLIYSVIGILLTLVIAAINLKK